MSFEVISNIWTKYQAMFLRGARTTILISLIGTVLGLLIGFIVAILLKTPKSENRLIRVFQALYRFILNAYIEIFRCTPMIVQSMVIYYGALQFLGLDLDRFVAAIFIVSINTGAYLSEIVRGGLDSIDRGQLEACQSVGMGYAQSMRFVLVPQAFRRILPAIGNEFVINIKDTSVLNVISVSELFFVTKTVAGGTFRHFDTYFITCVIYFVLTFIFTRFLRYLERRIDGPKHYQMYDEQVSVSSDKSRAGRFFPTRQGRGRTRQKAINSVKP